MDWIRSMQKAISVIEENLLDDINTDEIAKSVYFSTYHFNRIFNMITGVTIGSIFVTGGCPLLEKNYLQQKQKL